MDGTVYEQGVESADSRILHAGDWRVEIDYKVIGLGPDHRMIAASFHGHNRISGTVGNITDFWTAFAIEQRPLSLEHNVASLSLLREIIVIGRRINGQFPAFLPHWRGPPLIAHVPNPP